jgi:HD-GYP domain-containing protein (c-di-GMP phosphodiesterase class II)
VYRVTSIPVNLGDEHVGVISVGEEFRLADFSTPMVILRDGKVIGSSLPEAGVEELEATLAACGAQSECEVRVGGKLYLSACLKELDLGRGYALRSFQNLDAAIAPVHANLRQVFLIMAAAGIAVALVVGTLASRSIVRPIARMVSHLRHCEATGDLPEFRAGIPRIFEIQELAESFNRASVAIRASRDSLHQAYVEFVGSLASALDARDPYTAGHSRRVSEYSVATAQSMNLSLDELEVIRIGALLHDVGKIGINDQVLQKPGKLDPEEFALIKAHPSIGRRIVEGINGFEAYIPVIELHHENWDGSGYPLGLTGAKTPVAARIVHVTDAYDAMTSNRPYRRCLSHEEAVRRLREGAGTQFDAGIVKQFLSVLSHDATSSVTANGQTCVSSLQKLAEAIESNGIAAETEIVGGGPS